MNVKTHAQVIVPNGADGDCLFAANELIKYVEKIFGVRCALLSEGDGARGGFYVGETEFAKRLLGDRYSSLEEDAFAVESGDDYVVLTGKSSVYSRAGTIYAVYDLLERLGARFFAPDEEKIPSIPSGGVPRLSYVETPAFETRQILASLTRKHHDYTAKMRVKDCYCGDVPGGALSPLWANGRSGSVQQGHNFFDLVPPAEFKQDHPEWYDEKHGQLCFSQPTLVEAVANEVVDRMRKNPLSKFFAVSQNDTVDPCDCEKCKAAYEKYGVSGALMRFINAVARRVKETTSREFPGREAYIVTFAYYFSIKAPVERADGKPVKRDGKFVPLDPSVVPEDNVYVFHTTIDHCFYHSLTDENCEWNEWFKENFEAWKQLCGGRIMEWNYSINYAHYLYPFFNFRTMRSNYAFFADNGVKHILDHGNCEGLYSEFNELRTYMLSKICWNPRCDAAAVADEFLDGYYKSAADGIKRYLSVLDETFKTIDETRGYHLRLYHLPESTFAIENFPVETLEKLESAIASALNAAAGDETIVTRVKRVRASLDYLILMNFDGYGLSGKEKLEARLLADCKDGGITKHRETFGGEDKIPELIEMSRKNEMLKY